MLFQDILNLEECKGKLTCVTFSKTPFIRLDIEDLDYVNYNSIFYSESDFFIATLESLKLVNTEYVIFCDSDDPFPQEIILPDYGLIYGDFLYRENNKNYTLISKPWNEYYHLNNPWLIHKPVIRTDSALDIINKIPFCNIHFNFAFYYFIAKYKGSQYNNSLKVFWNKGQSGEHKKIPKLYNKSLQWIKEVERNYLSI